MPVVMTACSEADVWVHALNKRQLVQQEHESLTRTAWQNAAELYHLQACFFIDNHIFLFHDYYLICHNMVFPCRR